MSKQQQQPTIIPKPFKIGNLAFVNYRTFINFLVSSLLIIVAPIVATVLINNRVKDSKQISELMKVVYAVAPAVLWINIIMGVYVYQAFKDPLNYTVDEAVDPQKGFKQFVEAKNKKNKKHSKKQKQLKQSEKQEAGAVKMEQKQAMEQQKMIGNKVKTN